MTAEENEGREIVERFVEAVNKRDFDALGELLHPEFVQEIPQSGERVHGPENFLAILENYPGGIGGPQPKSHRVVIRPETRYVMTPSFRMLKVAGSGEHLAFFVKAKYPDGEWYVIHLVTLRDGRIAKDVNFFARPFEAPAWRAQWVEPMDE